MLVGGAFMLYRAVSNKRAEKTSAQQAAEMGNLVSVDFLKTQLERQRDFYRGKRFWSLQLTVILAQLLIAHQSRIFLIIFIMAAIVTVPMSLRMTRKYQHQLDEINRLHEENQ